MISVREAHENFYPIVSRTLKYALICYYNILVLEFWCIFDYTTIITLCFGLNLTIFAVPIYSV